MRIVIAGAQNPKEALRFARRLARYLRRMGGRPIPTDTRGGLRLPEPDTQSQQTEKCVCVLLGGCPPPADRIICSREHPAPPPGALVCGLSNDCALTFSSLRRGRFSICGSGGKIEWVCRGCMRDAFEMLAAAGVLLCAEPPFVSQKLPD